MENPQPTYLPCIQIVGFLTAPQNAISKENQAALQQFSISLLLQLLNIHPLSPPQTLVNRKKFLNNSHAVCIKLTPKKDTTLFLKITFSFRTSSLPSTLYKFHVCSKHNDA